jgi:hypothetical protein
MESTETGEAQVPGGAEERTTAEKTPVPTSLIAADPGVGEYLRTAQPPTPPRESMKPRIDRDALAAEVSDDVTKIHPLLALMETLDEEKALGDTTDHGSWLGLRPTPSRSEFLTHAGEREFGLNPFPTSADSVAEWQACAAATARREIPWGSLSESKPTRFSRRR